MLFKKYDFKMHFEKKILLFEKKLNTTTYKLSKGIFFFPPLNFILQIS